MIAATRAVPASAESVLVVRGAQMGIDLVARTLLSPGDNVAVEALGYKPAWEALASSGAKLKPIPVDDDGLQSHRLPERLRAVYVTPHHQFPSTVTMSPARRLQLLELAKRQRFFILEDDYDHEFHYEGRPVMPIAASDDRGSVIYVGTFSKVLAPGLRVGFVVAPPPVIQRLARTRRFVDRQGDHALAAAITELIEDGEVQRHVHRARRIYAERRERTAKLLREHLGSALEFAVPRGGTAIWARVDAEIDVDAWSRNAATMHQLVLQPGSSFSFDGKPRPYLRLGFAQHTDREAREAVKRLAAAMPKRQQSTSRSRQAAGTRSS
jgi:GntR family transcriptional regulator/MocR family aminotransferase